MGNASRGVHESRDIASQSAALGFKVYIMGGRGGSVQTGSPGDSTPEKPEPFINSRKFRASLSP